MTVFTRSLAIDRQEHSWKVRLSYDLEMDNQPSGRICLRIEIEEEKISGHEECTGGSCHSCRPESH